MQKNTLDSAVLLALLAMASGAHAQSAPSAAASAPVKAGGVTSKAAQPAKPAKAGKPAPAAARQDGASEEVASLKQSVAALQAQLKALEARLQQAPASTVAQAPAAPSLPAEPAGTEGESQEAQDARTPATKADVQGLRADLENYKYDQSRLQERNIPSVTRNTKLGGTVTLGWEQRSPAFPVGDSQTTAATAAAPGEVRRNGFRAPAVAINLAGNLYRDYNEGRNLTYRFALNVGTTGTNASNNSQVNLTDAWIRYSFQPSTGNAEDPLGTVTLGQQPVPFGLDAPALDPEVRPVINSALFVTGLDLATRQIGLQVSGDLWPYVDFTNNYRAPVLAYSLGVFNGNGPNKADNNSARDVIGRLVFTLPVDYTSWLRQLQLGASYYSRQPTVGTANATATEGVRGHGNVKGVDLNWTHLPYSVSYEWARGESPLAPTAANRAINPDDIKRGQGHYINFGYTWGEQFLASSRGLGRFDDYWPKSFQTFVRFDAFDPNLSAKALNDRQYRTTLGLNVFFAETTRLQLNLYRDRNQAKTAALPARANGAQAQFVAGF